VLIGRTSHRGTSQDEGEGEDEAGGPHLTCLRLSVAGSACRLVGNLITVGCFRTSAPKRKMVSSRVGIVSSALSDETRAGKIQ
jgi:hypothetical protein